MTAFLRWGSPGTDAPLFQTSRCLFDASSPLTAYADLGPRRRQMMFALVCTTCIWDPTSSWSMSLARFWSMKPPPPSTKSISWLLRWTCGLLSNLSRITTLAWHSCTHLQASGTHPSHQASFSFSLWLRNSNGGLASTLFSSIYWCGHAESWNPARLEWVMLDHDSLWLTHCQKHV